jgi:uncharacterized protein YehS (DUF1456 family)
MIALWALADQKVTREQVNAWLKKDDDPAYVNCSDRMLAVFLNGMINHFRGKKDGPQMAPESRINNNIVLRKLKIALNLRDEKICEIIDAGGMPIGKSELSAFFRKVGHRHYRELQDQMLRKFMQGLQAEHRNPNEQTKNTGDNLTSAKGVEKPSDKTSKQSETKVRISVQDTDSSEDVNRHIWGK